MHSRRQLLLASLYSPLIWSCTPTTEIPMNTIIPFKLGPVPAGFLKNVSPKISGTDKDVKGNLAFYELHWEKTITGEGTMRFEHGAYSFNIGRVISFLGTQIHGEAVGIHNADVMFTFSDADDGATTHQAARDAIFGFMKQLQAIGWRKYIAEYYPRIKGQDSLWRKFNHENGMSPDPNYIPTMQEWVNGSGPRAFGGNNIHVWDLWADGVYIQISFHRADPSFSVSKTPGLNDRVTYLFEIRVKTEGDDNQVCIPVPPSDENGITLPGSPKYTYNDWVKFAAASREVSRQKRAKIEANMRKSETSDRRWDWDNDYRDPPLLGLGETEAIPPPAVPSVKSGQAFPKTGLWKATLPDWHSRYERFTKANGPVYAQEGKSLSAGLIDDQEQYVTWVWVGEYRG